MTGESNMTRLPMQRLAKEYGKLSGLAEQGFMGLDGRGPGVPGMPRDEAEAIGLTIAGEIDPRFSPYDKPLTAQEVAAILGVIDNRVDLDGGTRRDVALRSGQFSTWNDARRRNNARQNHAKYQGRINQLQRLHAAGKLESPARFADHYWSPKGVYADSKGKRTEPVWAPDIINRVTVGSHIFGTRKDRLEAARQASLLRGVEIPPPAPRPLAPAEQAYVDYGRSRLLGPVYKAHGDLAESLGEAGVRGLDGRGASQPEQSGGGVMDWLDWIVPDGRR